MKKKRGTPESKDLEFFKRTFSFPEPVKGWKQR